LVNPILNAWGGSVYNLQDMSYMFKSAVSFNEPIDTWVTPSLTSLSNAFQSATLFNQNIGTLNIINTNVFTFVGILDNSGMDTANYDSTLVGWAAQSPLPFNASIGVQGRVYTSAGAGGTARAYLQSAYSWNFIGDIGI
jgi:hypothetical protein